MTQTDLDDKVISISYKWKDQICQLNSNQLKEEMFLERIKKGALYFHSQLTELFNHTLEITKDVQTNNKSSSQKDSKIPTLIYNKTLIIKQELLSTMIAETFTITNYLEAKQNAILNSLDDEKEKKGRKEREKQSTQRGFSRDKL